MNKDYLQKMQSLFSNRQWKHFEDYLNELIEVQQKSLEQADNQILVYRSQGAITALRRLANLKNEVRNSNGNSI